MLLILLLFLFLLIYYPLFLLPSLFYFLRHLLHPCMQRLEVPCQLLHLVIFDSSHLLQMFVVLHDERVELQEKVRAVLPQFGLLAAK